MATPAAILSVLVKANTAQASASLHKFDRQLKDTDKTTGKWKGRMAGAAKVAGVGMAAGVGVGIVALKGFADAAIDSEKSNARMRAQLKASGIDYGKHSKHINDVIAKHSQLSALDDEDLQDSFTNIVRVTGNVNKALELNALAADFARAKNMDVAKAGELVGKVAGGNTGILSRYGIAVKEGATATEALGVLQQKFQGQAKAYGETAGAANDRFKVAVENLQEALGARLLPVIAKVMNFVSNFVNSMTAGSGAAGGFGKIVSSVWQTVSVAVGTAVSFMVGLFKKHRDDYRQVREAAGNVGKAIAFVWAEVVLPIIKRVLPAVVQIIQGAFTTISGIVKTISALLTGDWRRAWEGVKQIFSGAIQAVIGMLRGMTAPLRELGSRVGSAIQKPFVDAFNAIKGVAEDVLDVFEKIVGVVEDIIDFIGDIKIPKIDIPFIGGRGNGKTVGPVSGVDSFNALAASFGNVVTSGYRPGDPGWHGQNRARDYSGGNLGGFARAMLKFAPQLLELIYTPLGVGVKNGNIVPISFFGSAVMADHYDHVHVAMRRGGEVPGMGIGDTVPAMLEPGEFVVRKKVVDLFGPTFFAGLNGMKGGGLAGTKAQKAKAMRVLEAVAAASRMSRRLPLINRDIALAALTPELADDVRFADELVRYWEGQLGIAQASGRGITAAAQSLKSARDAREGLNVSTVSGPIPADNSAAIAELTAAINRQIEFNKWMINTQGPSIVNAVVAAVNGGIGGPVGLGFQGIRSSPGSVAGL